VKAPNLKDLLEAIKVTARAGAPMVTVPEIVKTFPPSF
jgi:hypothetical protein